MSIRGKILEQILERAMEYYQSDIADKNDPHIQKYQEQLCTCYLKRTDMIDFDFWTRYIELLDDPTIDFDEYTELDLKFDGSIEEVTAEDTETITRLKEILAELRKSNGEHIKELELVMPPKELCDQDESMGLDDGDYEI